ncbi:helix-turn-helix transcriptional regulator [Endozoicomonas arenosclerae]|uniref:helix-turn-helix transcriptional regulator n=1 Tax=Endozoicomonas arenosclerae TaxID=1633495 RepID=UPI0007827021|nr:helix-turn-helix transcriptional regulator [Endozoicomonas arenosclerae]
MSEQGIQKELKIASLVPEEKLTESLPPHWRLRFEKAIQLIHSDLSAPLNWQDIANQCHISPKHFLHMFRVIFHETPGQYQCRMRLKQAAYFLTTESDLTVKDIAARAGFSSSQALAKALKRELGVSASELRDRRYDMDPKFANRIALLLGQPHQQAELPLETSLAGELDFSISNHPERYFHTTPISINEPNSIEKVWSQIAPDDTESQVLLSTWKDTEELYENQKSQLGYPCAPDKATQALPAGSFLECRLRYSDLSGYYSAWSAFHHYVQTNNLTLEEQTPVLEVVHNPNTAERSVDITLSVLLEFMPKTR